MKTKLTTIFQEIREYPPMWVCLLFALVFSTNSWADPIAIGTGTGTVTLNYENTSNPTAPAANTYQLQTLSHNADHGASGTEYYIVFGTNPFGTYAKTYNSVEWSVTIEPGTYEIAMTYASATWRVQPSFDIYDGSTLVHHIYSPNSSQPEISDWKWQTEFSHTEENVILSVEAAKTYTIRVTADGEANSGFCMGHISFTRTDICTEYTAAFNASGTETSGSAPSSISKCASLTFEMPGQGTLFKSGYLFAGWNDGSNTYAVGDSYTMPAGGASFTAQWVVDNVSLRIPDNETELKASNYSTLVGYRNDEERDIDQDGKNDDHLNIWGGDATWKVVITPGTYDITTTCCVFSYGLHVKVSLIDPTGLESTRVIYDSGNLSGKQDVYKSGTHTETVNLSGLTEGKQYILKVEDFWDGNSHGGCHLMLKDVVFKALGVNRNISFANGNGNVTGDVPANTTCAEGGTYSLPSKGNLALTGNTFTGWSDGSNTYAAGASYTMPNHDVTFTAQWTPFILPTVTNASGTVDNNVVTIAYSIPGICDLSHAVASLVTPADIYGAGEFYVDQQNYNEEEDYISVVGKSVQWSQYGAGFNIPATTDLEWISYEFKGSYSDIKVWGGVCDNDHAYWKLNTLKNLNDANNWILSGEEVPDHIYWDGDMGESITNKTISQVAIYANAGNGTYDNVPFDIRNVRYHKAGQEDIDHVVIMRKAGKDNASTGLSDGTLLEPGTKSKFVDNGSKVAGWYTYTIFAVHEDGTLSEGVKVNAEVAVSSYSLTWNLNGGTVTTAGTGAAVNATGTPNSVVLEDAEITAPKVAKSGYAFAGWNTTPASTMPAANTTYTAQWIEIALHEPGKYEDDGEGGYDRSLTVDDLTGFNYEVYMFNVESQVGSLYAGSTSTVTDGYALTKTGSSEDVYDGWVRVKPNGYRSGSSTYNVGSEFIGTKGYARLGQDDYIRIYIQGYDQFSFAGRDDNDENTGYFKVKIDGVEQDYVINRTDHITRYSLTANEPHIIEISGANSDYHNRVLGFSLRLPVDDTPRSVTYANGNVAVTGDLPDNTSYAPLTEVTLPNKGNLAWTGHYFIGWDDGTKRYAAGETYTMPAHDVTLTAQWAEIHQPGKYETPEGEDGYGRSLTSVNNREYEVYRFAKVNSLGALYAGAVTTATDGHMIFNNAAEKTEIIGDNWIFVKPYDYSSTTYALNAEFTCLSGYARIRNKSYVRLYVQGYDQFAFAGRDDDEGELTGNFVVKIDGVTQDYTINRENHISDRYSLTSNDLHVIEITAVDDDYHNRLFGFSLRLPVDDTPRSLTYAKGDEEVTGDLPSNTSYAPLAEFTLPSKGNLAWAGHAFIGWSDGSNRYAAGETYTMPAHDVTFTAQWAEIHQPGKYETATASGGYGRTLQIYNNREYEVYEVAVAESKGALYAGPSTEVTNGYQIFTNATNATEIIGDNWVYVKARDYNADIRAFGNEFGQLNSEGTLSPQSARLDNASYVRLYVQGYDQFTFIGIDSYESTPNNYFVIKIDGVTQSYTPDADHYNYTRYDLDESIAHVIEVTANSSDYHNRFFGFSLRLPADDTQRSVTYAKGNEAVTGNLPASGSYVWGETFDLPAQGTLSWAEHYFIGWNDGTATYAPGYTYTMPRQAVTFTAQWLAPEYIPTTTSLNSTNVYVSPGTVEFNVDGEGDDEECINIAGKQTAEWKVYFTRGIYKLNMLYGTTSGGVNVTFKIFDGDTELTAYTRNDNHNDGSGVHLYNAKWDLDLRTIDENKLYTVKVIDTWGDTSSKPRVGSLNFSIVSPIVLSDTPVQLTHENVTFSPGTYDMDVDGIDGDETCVDIRDQQKADWLVQITPGYYQISMLYGTPGGTVKVQVMIIDAETGEPVEGKVTTEDIHYSGSSFLAKWGMDLRTGIDENKTYFVRVKDVFGGDGSKPEVAYINMVSVDPITVSSSVKTKLDHNNVTTPYTIEPFDIEENGSNETCLFIGDNNKADWLVKIAPITYNIRVRYGRTTGTRLTLYIIDGSNHVVWNSDTRPTPSGRYEVWEINGIDLSTKVNATDEYIIRIKDDYDGAGSYPYIEYIEFIPKVTHTRTGLTVGNYGTICLPYAVAAEDIHGADIFDMQGWPAGSVAVVLNEVDNMEAGRPYVIQAKATTATWSYYPEGDPTDAGTRNGLIGSYTKEVITPNANNYIVYDNKLYFVDVLAYVGANKAYINRTLAEEAAEPVAPAPGKRQIRLFLDGEQVITDIDQINDQMTNTKYMENGILYILREGKLYNAQGQLVK